MASQDSSPYHTLVNGHSVTLYGRRDNHFPTHTAHTDWLIVKFNQFVSHPLSKQFLDNHQLEIHERLDENDVYLCKYLPADLRPILSDGKSVTHLALYPNHAVPVSGMISGPTKSTSTSTSTSTDSDSGYGSKKSHSSDQTGSSNSTINTSATDDTLDLVLALHPNPSQGPREVLREVEIDFQAQHLDTEINPANNLVRVRLARKYIPAVAAIDSIRSIEEMRDIEPCSIAACQVLGIEPLRSRNPESIPSQFLNRNSPPFPWSGHNEVVHIADSGFDMGSVSDVHPAFTGRIAAVTTYDPAGHPADRNGHGTFIAGLINGNLRQGGGHLTDLRGTAPKAHVISVGINFSNFTPLQDLFSQSHGTLSKPKIHNNSWGTRCILNGKDPTQSPYGQHNAYLVDMAMYMDLELCVVFSAGNNGRLITQNGRQQQVGSWSAAKNSIVVGATYNSRPITGQLHDVNGTPHSVLELAQPSSRGPTLEGRIGVDVVAPGYLLLGPRSRSIQQKELDDYLQNFGMPLKDNTMFAGGTSMSTASVSGCVACLREAYRSTYGKTPTGAMLKALIIHGAMSLEGKEFSNETEVGSARLQHTLTMPPAPNTFQGYGLVNMQRSLHPIKNPSSHTQGCWEGFGQHAVIQWRLLELPRGLQALIVTLVYTDLPGAALQNVIRLTLQVKEHPIPIGPMQPNDPLTTAPPPHPHDQNDPRNNPNDPRSVPFTPARFTESNVQKIYIPRPRHRKWLINLDFQTKERRAPFAVVWSAW